MSAHSLPLPPDDPRQVKALEEAAGWLAGDTSWAHSVLDAYLSKLQEQGVVLVVQPPTPNVSRELSGRACGSCGHDMAAHRGDGVCLHCGCETVLVALDDVVEAIRNVQPGKNISGDSESWDALRNGMADFIERRFGGTDA
jgi:hypothetical protein